MLVKAPFDYAQGDSQPERSRRFFIFIIKIEQPLSTIKKT